MMRLFTLFCGLFSWLPVNADGLNGNAYQFSFQSIDQGNLPLSDYKGKVILIVNTASHCGFTSQYSSLQELWEIYKHQGLIVIGIPSGSFGNQEFGTREEIKSFCDINYGRTFPMTTRTPVTGEHRHPFYEWAEKELGSFAKPRWNFHKYLINRDGLLEDWFSSPTKPTSAKIRKAIESCLKKNPRI